MDRRHMVILPGVALAASRAAAQTAQTVTSSTPTKHPSFRKLLKYSPSKSLYRIPKTEAKKEAYVNFLTTLLDLNTAQAQQASTIFTNALAAHIVAKTNLLSAREDLGAAVRNNDGAGIAQASNAIGALAAQRHSLGANANAAFQQLLTPDQLAKLTRLHGSAKQA
jgi:hypothetical protein